MTRRCDTAKYRRRRAREIDNRRLNKRVGTCPLCRCPIRQSEFPGNVHTITVNKMTERQFTSVVAPLKYFA